MSKSALINKLASFRKLSDSYVDYKGQEAIISVDHKELILKAMGYDTTTEASLESAIVELETVFWQSVLEPVVVLVPDKHWFVDFNCLDLPEAFEITWAVALEDSPSQAFSKTCAISSCELLDQRQMGDQKISRRRIILPKELPQGYHQFSIQMGDDSYTCPLIATPKSSFQNNELEFNNEKIWGTAIQLYTLRSDNNWGIGDFADLIELVDNISEHGGDVIGLNPVHALFPNNPEQASPYSPSNRSTVNHLYIRPELAAEFEFCEPLKEWLASDIIKTQLAAARKPEFVDYKAVSKLKHQAFEFLFDEFKTRELGSGSDRDLAFQKFVAEQGEAVKLQATYDALLVHFSKEMKEDVWGWQQWPEAYQDHASPEVAEFIKGHTDEINFFLYLQFLSDEQLNAAHELTETKGMKLGLYRDLAVGANPGGAEVWSNKNMFCLDASVGAPPDALGPSGQNWGLPPLDPTKLRSEAYKTFITLVRNNMRSCNALRIDHAMALFRLWWCPPGQDANMGGYVLYNLDEMLGILNLESQRNECMIIAEDLGTVSPEVKEAFPIARLYSNKVFIFEFEKGYCLPPDEYKEDALAIVVNHDMPTLRSYWAMTDLELRKDLGMFKDEKQYQHEIEGRIWCKQHMLFALEVQGLLPDGVTTDLNTAPEMTVALSQALHAFVARGRSKIMVAQLEDMLLVEKPVNVPGTSIEYPNWKRKLTDSTANLFNKIETKWFTSALSQERG